MVFAVHFIKVEKGIYLMGSVMRRQLNRNNVCSCNIDLEVLVWELRLVVMKSSYLIIDAAISLVEQRPDAGTSFINTSLILRPSFDLDISFKSRCEIYSGGYVGIVRCARIKRDSLPLRQQRLSVK